MKDCDPIIVGGQSLNLWAQYYSARDSTLARMGPFTSKDLDLYVNPTAATRLAENLEDGKIYVAGLDDATANAAVVTGKLDGRRILVDFMAQVMGVDDEAIRNEYVAIVGPASSHEVKLLLMNPRDCVKSRLSNVNRLHREDAHSINQAMASIQVLCHFLDDLLTAGETDFVQRTLHDLQFVIRDHHLGKASDLRHGDLLDPFLILDRYVEDERLDARWRKLTLKKAIKRLRLREKVSRERHGG